MKRLLLNLACAITLTLFFDTLSLAENEPVQVLIGHDGNYKIETWTPLTLRMNPEIARMAPLDIDVVTALSQQDRMQVLRRYSASFSHYEGSGPAEMSIPVFITRATNLMIIQGSKEGQPIFRREAPLNHMQHWRSIFVLVLTTRPEDFNVLPSIKMESDIRAIFVPLERLGRDWTFYHAINCVVIDDLNMDSLGDKQFDALNIWLHDGGSLIFTSAGLELNATGKRFRSLADFVLKGKRRILSPVSLASFYGENHDFIDYVDALDVVAPESDILLEAEGSPLILWRKTGYGLLWTFTFSPKELPLRDRSRFDPLLRKVWTPILERSARGGRQLQWDKDVAVSPEAKTENVFGTVSLYILVLAIALGPLNFVLLKKLDKREYILLTIPAVTVLLGVGAFGIGLALKGNQTIQVTRKLTAGKAEDTVFEHRQYVGILSPRKTLLELSAVDAGGRMPHVIDPNMLEYWEEANKIGRFPLRIGYAGDALKVSDLEIPMWGMRFLEFVSAVEYEKGVTYSLRLDHDTLKGNVENGLSFPLKHCFLVARHNKVSLGDLEPNQRKEFEVKILPPPSLDDVRLTSFGKQEARRNIFHKVFWEDTKLEESRLRLLEQAFQSYIDYFENPVLIGWSDSPTPLKVAAEKAQNSGIESHLMLFELPLFIKERQIDIPVGVAHRECFDSCSDNPFALAVTSYCAAGVEFELPFRAHEKFDIEELTIHMQRPEAKDFMFTREDKEEIVLVISIYDWPNDKWVQLATTTQREIHQKVGDPARYVKFPQGLIRVKVEQTGGRQAYNYFSSGKYFNFNYGEIYFNPDFASTFSYGGIPLTYLDISLKGRFPEGKKQAS